MASSTIVTRDGVQLGINVFESEKGSPYKAGVIINSATGVKQRYYSAFAEYLSGKGFVVVTYDYRGIGESRGLSTRDRRLTMTAWGEYDLAAVIDWSAQHFPDIDWHCIGHSVGGQLIGLAHNNHRLTSVYNVAAQSGNWRLWHRRHQTKLKLSWYLLVSILSRVLGYLPGQLMGGEDLPQGVALDWARWCRNPNYICDDAGKAYRPHFSQVTIPMHFLILDDDHALAPKSAVKALANFYDAAKVSTEITTPEQRQHKFLGHFGFFKRGQEQVFWDQVVRWFESDFERAGMSPNHIDAAGANR